MALDPAEDGEAADLVGPLVQAPAVVYHNPQVVYHQQVGYLPQLAGTGPRPAWWGPRPAVQGHRPWGSGIPRPLMAPRVAVPRVMAPRAMAAIPATRPRRAASVPADLNVVRRRLAALYRRPK